MVREDSKKRDCDDCVEHKYNTRKIETSCETIKEHGKRLDNVEKDKLNNAAAWKIGLLIFSIITGSIWGAIEIVREVGDVGMEMKQEVVHLSASINKRLTETTEKTNEKIGMLQIDVATIKVQQKDQSERLYGLAAKQTVILEKMTVNGRDATLRPK